MLRYLAREDVPWSAVRIVQVDERIAPPGRPDRNLTRLRENLLTDAPVRPAFFARAGLDLTSEP
jgi:6-phosphogluconolactonase/glucosamine-6-phosphate isomerase/deaminase